MGYAWHENSDFWETAESLLHYARKLWNIV